MSQQVVIGLTALVVLGMMALIWFLRMRSRKPSAPSALLSGLALAVMLILIWVLADEFYRQRDDLIAVLETEAERASNPTERFAALMNGGHRLSALGRSMDARRFYREAESVATRLPDGTSRQVEVLLHLARIESDNGQARAWLQRALDLQERYGLLNHPPLADTLERLAWHHYPRSGESGRGLQLLIRALDIRRLHAQDQPEALAKVLSQIAFFSLFNQPDQAAGYLEESLMIHEQILGSDSGTIQSIALQVADYHFIAGRPAAAGAFLEPRFPAAPPEVQVTFASRLGWSALLEERHADALRWFEKASDLHIQTMSDDRGLLAISLDLDVALARWLLGGTVNLDLPIRRAKVRAEGLFDSEPLINLVESMVGAPEPTEPPEPERQWTVNRWLRYREMLIATGHYGRLSGADR